MCNCGFNLLLRNGEFIQNIFQFRFIRLNATLEGKNIDQCRPRMDAMFIRILTLAS